MKRIKRMVAAVLCLIAVLSVFSVPVSALDVSVSEGLDALRAQFSRGKGPKTDGYAIDYSYYSPVRSQDDRTSYPLVVITPGQGEGEKEGDELRENDFCTWAAREYQSRFAFSGGAYILIARSREDVLLSWNSEKLISPLGAAIKDFVKNNPNVDRNRIYALGFSYGGMASLRVAAAYPEMFAGVVSICAPITLSESRAKSLKNMSVWIVAGKTDALALYDTMVSTTWKRIKDNSENGENIRLTTYESSPSTTFLANHKVWLEVIDDFDFNKKGYSGRKTIDGNGKAVNISDGMISWLSRQGAKQEEPEEPDEPVYEDLVCVCDCHDDHPGQKVMWMVRVLIWVLTGKNENRICDCRAKHW